MRRFKRVPTIYVLNKNMKIVKKNQLKIVIFTEVKNRCILHGRVFVMVKGKKSIHQMSRVMRKPAFCICKNKDVDQLWSNCTADQRLCFRYHSASLIQNQASSHLLWLYIPVCVGPGQKPRRQNDVLMMWHICV